MDSVEADARAYEARTVVVLTGTTCDAVGAIVVVTVVGIEGKDAAIGRGKVASRGSAFSSQLVESLLTFSGQRKSLERLVLPEAVRALIDSSYTAVVVVVEV